MLRDGRIAVDGPPSEVLGAELPSRVYRQPVEVFPHPRTGVPPVVPERTGAAAPDRAGPVEPERTEE